MSKFRARAQEIKAAGEAERGNFAPTGTPKRIYDYWLRNTNSSHGSAVRDGIRSENFCHFWRVVAFWAPLMWVKNKSAPVLFSDYTVPVVFGLIGLLLLFLLITVDDTLSILLIVLLAFVAAAGVAGIGIFFGWLATRFPDQCLAVVKWGGIALIAGGVIIGATALIAFTGLLGVAIVAGTALVTSLLILNLNNIADYLEGRRSLRRAAAEERKRQDIEFYEENGYFPWDEVKAPGRLDKFFSGVADFIILLAQVVRVGKWKICPLVEIKE